MKLDGRASDPKQIQLSNQDSGRENLPYHEPEVHEISRTAQLIKGDTVPYWCGHDSQTSWGDIPC
jgi:hypothetical protein